ncbi:MAG: fumarate hydratase [Chloroflexi bacterium]|nr:MAG: fumarate hydratase [Chloroflexota bacterium]
MTTIPLREVNVATVRDAIEQLCLDANYVAADDVRAAFARAAEREVAKLGQRVLLQLLDNMTIAAGERVPMCQDTGTVVVFASIGQDVHFVGGSLRDAINDGVRRAYTAGYLRASMVARPIGTRSNTRDNTPAVLHLDIVEGSDVELIVFAKGGGAENMSRMCMLTPGDGLDGVKDFVIETVEIAGPNACPPVIVGVGVGGTFDSVGTLAKLSLARQVGSENPDPELAALEAELLQRINALGIGPHGFGGRTTALAVHVAIAPTHIASLPVAVNLQCGPAARVRRLVI